MIPLRDLAALAPADRVRVLVSSAKAEVNGQLWRAALGGADERNNSTSASPPYAYGVHPDGLDALVRQVMGKLPIGEPFSTTSSSSSSAPSAPSELSHASPRAAPARLAPVNAPYAAFIEAASARTGIPAATLSAIVGAEAGRGAKGAWNPLSRNPRSSAAGLGQFLSGTWLGMARQAGTWLNAQARERGLIDTEGHVAPGASGALLALRYEPQSAIEAVADYARNNVARLRQAGIRVGESAQDIARAAYVGHHLGPGDALRFYRNSIDPQRARALLSAQIGSEKAALRIAQTGDAAQAHRGWLLSYITRNIG